MEVVDEILAEEIQKKIEELNTLVREAVYDKGLRVDIMYDNFSSMGTKEFVTRFNCTVYKEVL